MEYKQKTFEALSEVKSELESSCSAKSIQIHNSSRRRIKSRKDFPSQHIDHEASSNNSHSSTDPKKATILSSSFDGSSFCMDDPIPTYPLNKRTHSCKPVSTKKASISRLKSLANINYSMKKTTNKTKTDKGNIRKLVKERIQEAEKAHYQRGYTGGRKVEGIKEKLTNTLFSRKSVLDMVSEGGLDDPRDLKSRFHVQQSFDDSVSDSVDPSIPETITVETDPSAFINDDLEDLCEDLIYYIRRGSVNESLNDKVIELLEECKIHPNEEIKNNGNTLMHFSAEHGNIHILKHLTKRGGSPYVVNQKGEGIMHLA